MSFIFECIVGDDGVFDVLFLLLMCVCVCFNIYCSKLTWVCVVVVVVFGVVCGVEFKLECDCEIVCYMCMDWGMGGLGVV